MKKIILTIFVVLGLQTVLGQNSWQNLSSPLGTGLSVSPIDTYNKNAIVKHGLNDTPVMLYIGSDNKINVKAFTNGIGWQSIGNVTNITTNNVTNIDMEIHPVTKEVFIVYSDAGSTPANRPIVKKYNGNNTWSTIGGDYLASTTSIINDINFDKNNEVCVAYIANPGSLNLKRFSSNNWNSVGISNIGTTSVSSNRNLDLEFSDSNIPYIVYFDSVGINNLPGYYLTRFFNNNWEYVNNSRIFNGDATEPRLAIVGEGIWVAYQTGVHVALGFYNNGWQITSQYVASSSDGVDTHEIEKYGTNLYIGYLEILAQVQKIPYQIKKYNTLNNTYDTSTLNSLIYNNPTSNRVLFVVPSISLSSQELPIVGYSDTYSNTTMAYYYGSNNFYTSTNSTYSCEAATSLTANSGIVNIGSITGNMPIPSCVLANDAPQLKANWWKFTPSQNGQLLVTSNISQNNTDTRLRIYSGNCNDLTCIGGNDNISTQNLNSQLSQLNLTAGTTYYIVFDNYNTNLSNGSFYYEFTPITGDSLSCSTAKTLAPYSATVNIGTIAGTIPASPVCYSFSQANPNANWWSFTPTQNGLLDITTITPQNAATVDTRLSIFTGTCSALTCFAGSDNVSTTDLRSNLNDLILQAGTTYYFVFDDKVSDNAAVNFFYEFTPQTCFRPNTVTFGTPTENTINVNWTAPTVGNTNPSSYTIQIGPRDYVVDSPAALQTITGLVANSTTITGLTANTVYDIYIKSNCSASDSSVWYGPFRTATEFTAVTPSYSENFDSDVSFLFVGWNRSGGTISTLWRTYTGSTPFVSSGTTSIYSPVEPALNTPTNTFAYTRKLNLIGGQNYIVSFMARQFIASGTTTSPSLNVSYTSNVDYTNPATHNQIVNLTNTSATAYTSENHNFSVTNSGQYRIAFKNDVQRTAGTGTAWLMLDSVTVSSALSTENFSKTALQLYPNPVLDNITIQNDDNLEIQIINIVDLNGRVVKEFKYSALNNNLMNISELESGIYIINLITSSQQVLSKKIIKE